MSLCAIIPVNQMQAANDLLEKAGYGPGNFSVPLYSATGATYAGIHSWGDLAFESAVKALAGVVWQQGEGDPATRFKALVEGRGVKWAAVAPALPTTGTVSAGALYRNDAGLWAVIQSYNIGVYGGDPAQYPALIRNIREAGEVKAWKQPIDQYDAYKVLNPFTGQNDECMHKGKKWYVTAGDAAGNNVWEPGVYGWSETDPTPNIFVRAWDWVKGLFVWK